MLPKNRRIPKENFSAILKEGKRYNSLILLLYVASIDKNHKELSRFSFSISKKICKKATDRNRYRRRGYSIIGNNIKRIKSGYFCFFSFKKESIGASFTILEKEIFDLLSVSNMLL